VHLLFNKLNIVFISPLYAKYINIYTDNYFIFFPADIMEDMCKSVNQMKDLNVKDLIVSPYSGKTCQNWGNLSDKAEIDFDTIISSRKYVENSTLCQDPTNQGILWCYVNDTGESLREPCFLPRKLVKQDADTQELA
jgi:hypothetical protein